MAQRYGGRYSPQGSGDNDRPRLDAPHPFDEKRRDRVGARANLLWLIPLLFAFRAFTVDPVGLPFLLAASGLAVLRIKSCGSSTLSPENNASHWPLRPASDWACSTT